MSPVACMRAVNVRTLRANVCKMDSGRLTMATTRCVVCHKTHIRTTAKQPVPGSFVTVTSNIQPDKQIYVERCVAIRQFYFALGFSFFC